MIIGVAIKRNDGRVFSLPKPFRHSHVIMMMVRICDFPKPIIDEQGFITHDGIFLERNEAGKYAIECGQIEKLSWPPDLYSEDLW